MLLEFIDSISNDVKEFWHRLVNAWDVVKGDAISMPMGVPNTVIVFSQVGKNRVEDCFMISSLSSVDNTYSKEISQLYGWVNSKNKHYWTSTEIGKQIMQEAKSKLPDAEFEEEDD